MNRPSPIAPAAATMHCSNGAPCDFDRVHEPRRLTPDDVAKLALCNEHRSALAQVCAPKGRP